MNNLISEFRENPNYKRFNQSTTSLIYFGAIGLAQVMKGAIVAEFGGMLFLFFVFQFVGSTVQGSLSDIYRRSTILDISLGLIIVIICFLLTLQGIDSWFFQISQTVCILCIAIGGNVDVVGRAGSVDIHSHMDRRKLMSWTVFSEAFSWVALGLIIRFFNVDFYIVMIICLIIAVMLLTLSLLFNIDKTQDKKHLKNIINEAKVVIDKKLKLLAAFSILVLVSELGFFFFFYSQELLIPKKRHILLSESYLTWFIGMLLGCFILTKIKKCSDFRLLLFGLLVSLLSVVLFWVSGMKSIMVSNAFTIDSLIFCLGGIGSGFFLPCFYSLISRGNSRHVQGILTGWVDSLRVAGDALSNLGLIVIVMLPMLPIIISALLFALSAVLLIAYRKRLFEH